MTTSRRTFLTGSTAALVLGPLEIPDNAHAAGSDLLKVGLVGCGGRGTGAAGQALRADPSTQLVALADAFPDRARRCLAVLKGEDRKLGPQIDVPEERCFAGFDAYKRVVDEVDVVLLCEPPGFRPRSLKYAVDAGKHVFAEKPVAVDAPGVRSVLATCEEAKAKRRSVVSGLCLRYSNPFREAIRRIHEGALGEVLTLEANDYRGSIWTRPRQPEWSEMEFQVRNWYYFTWLSGDFNVEQHVHYLDICAWVMKDRYPVRAVGMGGRQVRTGPEFGHIYDHFSVVYEYEGGARLYSNCRQQTGCSNEMSAEVVGTKGRADLNERRIALAGENPWKQEDRANDIYQTEHDVLFAAIRKDEPVNNGEYMAKSTLMAIMGRMSAYTGQAITWQQALNSKEDLMPAKLEWGPVETPPVAIPGKTKFF